MTTQCHHYSRVHPRMRGVRIEKHDASDFPAGSLSIAQVLVGYALLQGAFKDVDVDLVGIGSLGGGVVQADIDNLVAATGMAPPQIQILEVGGGRNNPADQDSNVENMLDISMVAYAIWHLTGKAAKIVIAFGPNAPGGMNVVTQALVDAGCKTVTWSWGSAAIGWDPGERAVLSATLKAGVDKGVTFFAASGDNSLDDSTQTRSADYPSSDWYMWGVGGTNMQLNPDGTIALESAWGDGNEGDEGGGGGVDPTVPMPTWQAGVVPGTKRGVPDSSANADPATGYQISANGSWTVVGGTSAAAPLTAAIVAVAKAAYGIPMGLLTPRAYVNRAKAFNDITTGSNGDRATPGWDDATGLGTPNGETFLSVLVGP